LERMAGPLPLSLRAWYEQVGGVSLMGSDPVLNPSDFSNRGVLAQFDAMVGSSSARVMRGPASIAPDPLVVMPVEEVLQQVEDFAAGGEEFQVVISPDDLQKANVSGCAYYLRLPDGGADFPFDDWHHTTFVNYLRIAFEWGGFPGWARSANPPRREIEELRD